MTRAFPLKGKPLITHRVFDVFCCYLRNIASMICHNFNTSCGFNASVAIEKQRYIYIYICISRIVHELDDVYSV